jgi:hypothetical protein
VITFISQFFPGSPVSSTNKIDYHDITEIMLKAALKHNNPTLLFSNIKYDHDHEDPSEKKGSYIRQKLSD